MKEFIVFYNVNSRGRNLTQDYIESLFRKHELSCKIFMTKSISELGEIIDQFTDTKKYIYCAIGGLVLTQ